jgi:hypothetical protein
VCTHTRFHRDAMQYGVELPISCTGSGAVPLVGRRRPWSATAASGRSRQRSWLRSAGRGSTPRPRTHPPNSRGGGGAAAHQLQSAPYSNRSALLIPGLHWNASREGKSRTWSLWAVSVTHRVRQVKPRLGWRIATGSRTSTRSVMCRRCTPACGAVGSDSQKGVGHVGRRQRRAERPGVGDIAFDSRVVACR